MVSTGISMGSLVPGVPLIYERVDSTVYSRRAGKTERTVVGYDHDPRTSDGRPLHDHIMEDKMWGDIRRTARTNLTLQDALDRAIMIYQLSKTT
jgi:hypothetical protein